MTDKSSLLTELILKLPWPEVLAEAWKYSKKIIRGYANEGMFEVLDYEATLELLNRKGTRAKFNKRRHVRYLQDNIIAFQDYAWGDGEILVDYKCSPGKPVDQYKLGYKHYLLISLGTIRNKGEEDKFQFQWKIKNGFLKPDGFWGTDISERTKRIKLTVVFPRSRPPIRASIVESNHRRTHALENENFKHLPDGRVEVSWVKESPRLYELYLLRWDW